MQLKSDDCDDGIESTMNMYSLLLCMTYCPMTLNKDVQEQ